MSYMSSLKVVYYFEANQGFVRPHLSKCVAQISICVILSEISDAIRLNLHSSQDKAT